MSHIVTKPSCVPTISRIRRDCLKIKTLYSLILTLSLSLCLSLTSCQCVFECLCHVMCVDWSAHFKLFNHLQRETNNIQQKLFKSSTQNYTAKFQTFCILYLILSCSHSQFFILPFSRVTPPTHISLVSHILSVLSIEELVKIPVS